MAKLLASEFAVQAATTALLLHGGAGYMEEMKVARPGPAWTGCLRWVMVERKAFLQGEGFATA
jgi:hypothetical protein